ncbi:MAG: Glu-tRNA(Gln) amidotransferase GatDE subunit E, partial [Candidatus Aenigmatarchaeota archaeon]
ASQIVNSERLLEFEKFREVADSKTVANVFTNTLPRLESDNFEVEKLEERHFQALFEALESGDISKGDIEDVLKYVAENPAEDAEEAVEESVAGKASEEEIREAVKEVMEEKSGMVEDQGMRAQGALMGLVMQRVEADGSTVSKILQEELEKELD